MKRPKLKPERPKLVAKAGKGKFFHTIKELQAAPRMDFKTSTSIWPVDELIRKASAEWREYSGEDGRTGSRAGAMREEETAYSGTYSLFPGPLAQWAYIRYAGPKTNVIIDPFAGGPIRGVVAAAMGYEYHGVDVRQEAIDENEEVMEEQDLGAYYHLGDARYLQELFDENSFEFAIACPPYYNLEVYSDLPGDLSNRKSYEDFLHDMFLAWRSLWSVMKDGAFVCAVIGNFRQGGDELFDFRGHTVAAMEDVGFTFWQDIVLSRSMGSAAVRAATSWKGKKLVPRHEYLLVFKKIMEGK